LAQTLIAQQFMSQNLSNVAQMSFLNTQHSNTMRQYSNPAGTGVAMGFGLASSSKWQFQHKTCINSFIAASHH
jgi:hypothetical protein